MSSEAIAAIVAAVITGLFAARWAERKQKQEKMAAQCAAIFLLCSIYQAINLSPLPIPP